ncbi:MAG: flagellar motor protein MotB [bacterium]
MSKNRKVKIRRRIENFFYPSFFYRTPVYLTGLIILVLFQSGCLVSAGKYRLKTEELNKAMTQNKRLTDKYEALLEEKEKLEEKNVLLTSALDARESTDKTTINDLNAENKQLREDHKKFSRENEDLKNKIVNIAHEKKTEIDNLKTTYNSLVGDMKKELDEGKIQITQLENKFTVSIVDKILFESGQVEVKEAGRAVLKRIGDILKKVADRQIRIEGYTDNVPIGRDLVSKYPTNWELSATRAINVAKYLQGETGIDPTFLSVGAYSQYRPIADNSTPEGRAKNRRIEIVLVPMDFEPVEQTQEK